MKNIQDIHQNKMYNLSKASFRQQLQNKRALNELQVDTNAIKFPTTHIETYKDLNLKNFIFLELPKELE